MYDVIIIGGGPAGLNAALILGRSRRNILLCDNGQPRNKSAKKMHGFLSRDGINPNKLLEKGREELKKYGVKFCSIKIETVKKIKDHFEAVATGGEKFQSKKILIATGIKDRLPPIPGIEKCYGISVHHCPYCDGWEVRDKKIAVYAKGKAAYAAAQSLKSWSDDVFILTDGEIKMPEKNKVVLEKSGIKIISHPIERLEEEDGYIKKIIFKNKDAAEADALFFKTDECQMSSIAKQLECSFTKDGYIKTNRKQQTAVKGVFVAGDAAKDMQFVIVAAAEGAKAAITINTELQEEERLHS